MPQYFIAHKKKKSVAQETVLSYHFEFLVILMVGVLFDLFSNIYFFNPMSSGA